jgi:hypothetical protein
MDVFFQLLDRSSGNVIKDYPSQEAALEELRRLGTEYGVEELRTLALLRFQDGQPSLVAMEDDLVALLNLEAEPRSLNIAALTHR